MAQGKHTPSFASNLLDGAGSKMSEQDEFIAKWTAVAIYLGGADTVSYMSFEERGALLNHMRTQSAAAIATFFLAMTW
jgi:hypothetical protein